MCSRKRLSPPHTMQRDSARGGVDSTTQQVVGDQEFNSIEDDPGGQAPAGDRCIFAWKGGEGKGFRGKKRKEMRFRISTHLHGGERKKKGGGGGGFPCAKGEGCILMPDEKSPPPGGRKKKKSRRPPQGKGGGGRKRPFFFPNLRPTRPTENPIGGRGRKGGGGGES